MYSVPWSTASTSVRMPYSHYNSHCSAACMKCSLHLQEMHRSHQGMGRAMNSHQLWPTSQGSTVLSFYKTAMCHQFHKAAQSRPSSAWSSKHTVVCATNQPQSMIQRGKQRLVTSSQFHKAICCSKILQAMLQLSTPLKAPLLWASKQYSIVQLCYTVLCSGYHEAKQPCQLYKAMQCSLFRKTVMCSQSHTRVHQTLQRRAVQCSFIGISLPSQVQCTVLCTQFWVHSKHISHLRMPHSRYNSNCSAARMSKRCSAPSNATKRDPEDRHML